MKRILVPLDGSALSEAVIPVVLDLAAQMPVEITLLRVVLPFIDENYGYLGWGPVGEWAGVYPPIEEGIAHARAYLEEVRSRMGAAAAGVVVDARAGLLPDAILAAIGDTKADVVAMSTHGRGGLGRLVMGSVTDLVIRLASVPVLVVRPHPVPGAKRPQAAAKG